MLSRFNVYYDFGLDRVLRYSNETTYTPKASDREYKKVTDRYEMHGKTLYRTHSYVFKYESVKLKLDEGFKRKFCLQKRL